MAHRFTDRTVKNLVNLEAFTTGIQYEEYEDTKGVIRFRIEIRQWPEEKVHKDKQRSTKHAHKTNDPVTRTPHKTGVNSGAPEG